MRFKIAGFDTWYRAEQITPRQAEAVGCPNATHRIIGQRTGTVHYGYMVKPAGARSAPVKVPGTKLMGTRLMFNGELHGYLIED